MQVLIQFLYHIYATPRCHYDACDQAVLCYVIYIMYALFFSILKLVLADIIIKLLSRVTLPVIATRTLRLYSRLINCLKLRSPQNMRFIIKSTGQSYSSRVWKMDILQRYFQFTQRTDQLLETELRFKIRIQRSK